MKLSGFVAGFIPAEQKVRFDIFDYIMPVLPIIFIKNVPFMFSYTMNNLKL